MFKSFLAIFVVLLVVTAASVLTPAAGKDEPKPQAPVAVPVKTAIVTRKDMPVILKAVGTVVPRQTVAIKSRLDSQIMEVRFKDGDNVKKGAPLFILDDRVLKAQLAEAQANLQKDKAQLQNLQQQFNRTEKLAGQGYATGATRDDARAALDAQAAVLVADNAAMENIRVQLGYTIITAPIDGRTGTINVTVGNNVKANDTQALVTINQIQPVLVQASLPQGSFDKVRTAMTQGAVPTDARRDGNNEAIQGQLEYIDNAIDQGTGTFAIRSVFANANEHLWPGMLVNLSVILSEDKQVQVIPDVAVQHAGTGDFVYVVNAGKAAKKPVIVARMQDGLALIAQGLLDNDQVVVDGQMSLKEGSAVTTQ